MSDGCDSVADLTLVLPIGDDRCQVFLACGHWSEDVSVASSMFDFPMDATYCRICKDDRYLDVRLQVALLEGLEERRDDDE